MSNFYLARAAECAVEAELTELANVRERCRRSEAAWRIMAERQISIETGRLQRVSRPMPRPK